MLALIAFMLLVCLLSCLYKVHKRNEKNKKLLLLAQQTDKGEGQAFRQVMPPGGGVGECEHMCVCELLLNSQMVDLLPTALALLRLCDTWKRDLFIYL